MVECRLHAQAYAQLSARSLCLARAIQNVQSVTVITALKSV
jgi:hypothetical protein